MTSRSNHRHSDAPFRVYEPDECGADGYPLAWHKLVDDGGAITDLLNEADMLLPGGLKDVVRALAGHRCVRCGHPYRSGHHGNGEWSPCGHGCTHGDPTRWRRHDGEEWNESGDPTLHDSIQHGVAMGRQIEARWRILTVHHLRLGDDAKRDLRWWNLAALCQHCHLQIQGKVVMERIWPWPHSEWFKPYAAGWYAHAYLGEDISRAEAEDRMDELLALELAA